MQSGRPPRSSISPRDIKKLTGISRSSVRRVVGLDDLKDRVCTCWASLDQQLISKAVDQWQSQLKAVVQVHGGRTLNSCYKFTEGTLNSCYKFTEGTLNSCYKFTEGTLNSCYKFTEGTLNTCYKFTEGTLNSCYKFTEGAHWTAVTSSRRAHWTVVTSSRTTHRTVVHLAVCCCMLLLLGYRHNHALLLCFAIVI